MSNRMAVAVDLVVSGGNGFIAKTSQGKAGSEGLLLGPPKVGCYTEKC